MTKLEKRITLNEQIYVKLGNKPKLIKLIKKARELDSHVEQDLRELFTSKRIGWK